MRRDHRAATWHILSGGGFGRTIYTSRDVEEVAVREGCGHDSDRVDRVDLRRKDSGFGNPSIKACEKCSIFIQRMPF